MRTLDRRNRGVALVVTLLLIGFLSLLLLAYLMAAGGSRKRSSADREHARARLYLDVAAQEAMAKIATGFADVQGDDGVMRGSVTASPGLMEIRYFDIAPNRGTEKGAAAFADHPTKPPFFRNPFLDTYSAKPANPRWIPLFSWKWFAPGVPNLKVNRGRASDPNPDYNPAAIFDFNTTQNPFYPGHHYLTGVPASPVAPRFDPEEPTAFRPGEVAADRPVFVQWLSVLKDPAEKPGERNPMVGRYAYWVDVENTKVNLLTSTRPLRQTTAFGRLTGEPDGDHGANAFEQGTDNPARRAQEAVESALARKATKDGTFTANGQPGQGSNLAARSMRELLLAWNGNEKPVVADTSLVDWDYFNGLRPMAGRRGEKIAFDDLIGAIARHTESGSGQAFNTWDEVFSLLDPAIQREDPAQARIVRDSLRRTLGASTTIYGYEEERDPLGRPKLDLVKFLLESRAAVGATGNPAAFKSTELWARLVDPEYYRAYFPAGTPSGGVSRSFASALNRFAGTGNANDSANGEIALQQMLLNVVEATLPPDVPPHIDPNTGLVAMRSMPYVAEVATRARSALWLLPESMRANPESHVDSNGLIQGKPLSYYLTHVIVDLAVACVNPDPFSSRPFQGTLKLDYSWHQPPAGSDLVNGPQTAPLVGKFTALPLPGDKAGRIRVDGETVYFRLGVLPGSALVDKAYAQTLRIRGWEIRDGSGALWHQVPIRHPRAASAPQWWQMAEQGVNAGMAGDARALTAFQENSEIYGYRAVGWFAVQPGDEPHLSRIFMSPDDIIHPEKVDTFLARAAKATFVERVFSRDPALGHRTGNRALTGTWGRDAAHQKGHYYGLLGHTWRRHDRKGAAAPPEDEDDVLEDDGDGESERQVLVLNVAAYSDGGTSTFSMRMKRPVGIGYVDDTLSVDVPGETAASVEKREAEAWWVKADSLTAFFFDPRWEKCPLWELDGALSGDDSKEPMKDTDVETSAKILTVAGVKTKDLRLGARGFFAGAPRGAIFTSIGELGFCHSGLPNFPILLTDATGWNEYLINSPRNGPPMRMLLDLFTPGVFTDPETGRALGEGSWRTGQYTSHSPIHPRRGTWSMNTTIAHDGYMAIREGDTDTVELKKEFEPGSMSARVAWIPSAAGYRRAEAGAEYYRGKKLEDTRKKSVIGQPLDRYAGPSPVMNRGMGAWVSLLGGDFSPGRVTGGTRWGFNNAGVQFFGPPQFTWNPGNGGTLFGSTSPFVDFTGDYETPAQLLTFGSDGRKEGGADEKTSDIKVGHLRGRFAADQGLIAAQPNPAVTLPLQQATRFSLMPMRHFTSELACEYQFGAAFTDIKTALNPRQSAYPATEDLKQSDGNAFPGGHHASGVFANAPAVLLANQVSTSANVFTIHVVAQAVKDRGVKRDWVPNSGPGYSDPDDEVLSERWARIVVAKLPPKDANDQKPRFRILSADYRNAGE